VQNYLQLIFIIALGASASVGASTGQITVPPPRSNGAICTLYQQCVQRGIVEVTVAPASGDMREPLFYAGLRKDGSCAPLIIDARLYRRLQSVKDKLVDVTGILVTRGANAEGTNAVAVFDRWLPATGCSDAKTATYVLEIRRAN
jgi:hypothetical protein